MFLHMLRQPFFVVRNGFSGSLGQRKPCVLLVWKPLNNDPLPFRSSCQRPQIVDDVPIVDVVHQAHERMREIVGHRFNQLKLHYLSGITPTEPGQQAFIGLLFKANACWVRVAVFVRRICNFLHLNYPYHRDTNSTLVFVLHFPYLCGAKPFRYHFLICQVGNL